MKAIAVELYCICNYSYAMIAPCVVCRRCLRLPLEIRQEALSLSEHAAVLSDIKIHGRSVCFRKATITAPFQAITTVETRYFGSERISHTKDLFPHLATVFGLIL